MKKIFGEIGPWTEKIKLSHFGKYLQAYVKVFEHQPWTEKIYIDLFAGPGELSSKEAGGQIDGSPLIALKIRPPFTNFYFCEVDENNFKKLCGNVKTYKNVSVVRSDANEYVKELAPKLNPQVPIFAFLDPQALDLQYNTIEVLAQNKRVDFLINFPNGGALMRGFINKPGCPCEGESKCKKCPDQIFGHKEWRRLVTIYNSGTLSASAFHSLTLSLYMKPLEKLGYLWAVDHIQNSKNSHMYELIFASRNLTAMKIMRDLMYASTKQLPLWSNAARIADEIQATFEKNTSLTIETILKKMLTGDNTNREKDVQEALSILEKRGLLQRQVPRGKKVIRFKQKEIFKIVK